MKNNFSKILKTGKLCEVYFDPDNTGKFAVYRLLYVGNDCYVAAAYDKYGNYDGVECGYIDQTIKVATDTLYLKCLERLIQNKNPFDISLVKPTESGLLKNVLDYVIEKRVMCEIEVCGSGGDCVTGYVKLRDEESVTVECFDLYGKGDGESVICLDDITNVAFDTLDARKCEKLSLHQNEE